MKFLIILFIILLDGAVAFCQNDLLSGLYFSSHEVVQDKRTSLNLTPEKPFEFSKGFSLDFDASFRKGDGYYGYIFRIIGDNNTNIDLVSNSVSQSNFWLVYKDKILISYKWSDLQHADYDRWLNVRVDIDKASNKLAVTFNGVKQEVVVPEIANLRYFDIVFGACKNSSFPSTDVSPMSLKNVRVYDHKNQLYRDWRLSEHGKGKVYDEVTNAESVVDNPNWIRDKHVKWQKAKNMQVDELLGIAVDDEQGRLFLVNSKAVYVLSGETLNIDTIISAGGSPYLDILGKQIIYNKYTDELWSYNFKSDKISRFDLKTHRWSCDQLNSEEPDFAHQNKFISPVDSSLNTILGYGHYTYKGLVNHYNKKAQHWEQIDRASQIEPRYLSAAGFFDDKSMLVFGGYGSKSGRQELSPEFYYNLYKLNLSDFTFEKLWSLDKPASPFVPCESLIVDQKSGSFYTLIYNSGNFATSLHLAKFEIGKNEFQIFDDSIPYNFLDVKSSSTLFLNKKTSQLVAVTSYNSDISVYTIAYPPLMSDEVYQSDSRKFSWYIWPLTGIISLGLLYFGFILLRRKSKTNKNLKSNEHVDIPNILPIQPFERKTVSSIFFIGGFQIFNSKGQNITSAFSPTLKQLFLFVFLHTIKNGKGVSSAKLDEVLWYDKSGESARNNRNVNISKLRAVLEDIGGMEIVAENSFWKIKLEDQIFCDYAEILNLLSKLKTSSLSESEIQKLIGLLSTGEFLPVIQTEWMDRFKSVFANEVIDGLSSLFNENDVKNNFSLRYHLAESILVYDPLNDQAIEMKCSTLYHLGKKGMAKNLYDSFCKEYKKVLGIDYAVSFNDIIK